VVAAAGPATTARTVGNQHPTDHEDDLHMHKINWPEGKRFAFTIFDDTDNVTLENAPPVYKLLADVGLRTTKSVWPIPSSRPPKIGGLTCADPAYLRWVQSLVGGGFEIALHGVTATTATRQDIQRGLGVFRELFGHDPASHANHADALDSIYWGSDRLSGLTRHVYRALRPFSEQPQGHIPGSPYFWGDLCKERIRYVRNFVYGSINTLRACPQMPYHDPERPFVNAWFACSEGANVQSFLRMLSEANQDRLEAEGGACIMYTHFASGFCVDGRLDPMFRRLMTRLTAKSGWFVSVATLLDYLRQQSPNDRNISRRERSRLERAWLRHKIRVGGTS
jgi:hypothetical protein